MEYSIREQLFRAGVGYLNQGLSVVVVGKNKLPIHKWTKYQKIPMTINMLHAQIKRPEAFGIAIIGGAVSQNFVTFDIDEKNDESGDLYRLLIKSIVKADSHLLDILPIATTQSGGHHFYYLTTREFNSCVVAKKTQTVQSDAGSEIVTYPVLIELRAKGEYAIVPPTPGYRFVQGDLSNVPVIGDERHDILVANGKLFDQKPPSQPVVYPVGERSRAGSPLDDFDLRGDVIQLLVAHGWTVVSQPHDIKRIYFRRPGKTKHKTSANFHLTFNTFMAHTTSTIFLHKKAYRPSAVFAILECNGDFRQAARQLIQLGFGISYIEQRRGYFG